MLRRHLNSTAGETVVLTDNAVLDRTVANCTALFSSGSSHISAREMVDICMCVVITLILTRARKNHDDKCSVTTEHTGTTTATTTAYCIQTGVDAGPLIV